MSTAPVVKIAGTGAAAATFTTTSYTPEANSRELAYVSAFKSSAGVVLPTIKDSTDATGANWHYLADRETTTFSNPAIRGAWFISDDTGPSPIARTVTVASTGANSMGVIVEDVLSADTNGTLAQAAATGEDLSTGDPSCTFGSTPGATNITLLGTSHGGGNAVTKPASFTSSASASNSTSRWNAASYDITSASIGPNQYTSGNQRAIIIGIELAPASAAKNLPAGVGSYSLSGTAAALAVGRKVAAAAGSYALAGAAATLRRALPLVAGAGSYSLSGATANLLQARKVGAAGGAYSLSGSPVSLAHGLRTGAGAGSYALTGQAATLRRSYVVGAASASYQINGTAATLSNSHRLTAGVGSYALTGADVGLIYTPAGAFVLLAGAGAYALTGSPASLKRSRLIGASAGAYSLGGQPAGLKASKRIAAAPGTYSVSGSQAGLRTSRLLIAANANYALQGVDAGLVKITPTVAPPERTALVAAEERSATVASATDVLAVAAEQRTVAIEAETRSATVQSEERLIAVPIETRFQAA